MALEKQADNHIVVLDVGSSSIISLVGRVGNALSFEIVGRGVAPSAGMDRNEIIDETALGLSIERSLRQAGKNAEIQVESVYVGCSGPHIRGLNSRGSVVLNPQKPIRKSDISKVIDSASFVAFSHDKSLMHFLPQRFIVEDVGIVDDPVGKKGSRLEVEAHMLVAGSGEISRLKKAVERANYYIDDIILSPLGSTLGGIMDEDKSHCMVVDIGAASTTIVIFADGLQVYTRVIGTGASEITADLSKNLVIPHEEAEEMKITFGCAKAVYLNPEDAKKMVQLERLGDAGKLSISRAELARRIERVVKEQIVNIRAEADKSGYFHHVKEIILTGGGALLEGLAKSVEEYFRVPVTTKSPEVKGEFADELDNPIYTAAFGMLCYAVRLHESGQGLLPNYPWMPLWMKKCVAWVRDKL